MVLKRHVVTYQHSPIEHVIESETVDYNNLTFSFITFGHQDPSIITVKMGKEERTLTREAMRQGFERLLEAIDSTPAQTPDVGQAAIKAARTVR